MTTTGQSASPTLADLPTLDAQVEEGRRQIRAEGYAMSLGELASLYEEDELKIQPKFQRFFRWTTDQKTRLVESILLGIPLPQVFVSQRDDGVWEVVDGLQRLSTLFEFMGKLRDEHGELKDSLRLTRAKYLSRLDGVAWNDLSPPLRIDVRRAKVNVSILNRGSDRRAKYDLFERLNTGGTPLSEQEVRNCILVMEDESFYDWLYGLAQTKSFQRCAAVSERLEKEGYHMELVCRLLTLSRARTEQLTDDIGPLVTDHMVELSTDQSTDLQELQRAFERTFAVFDNECLREYVFRRYSPDRDGFRGAFLISPFEVVACGIAHHLLQGADPASYSPQAVLDDVKSLWSTGGFLAQSRTGMSAKQRLRLTIPYGRERFAP